MACMYLVKTVLVKALLKEDPNVDVKAMDFPANWENEPFWK